MLAPINGTYVLHFFGSSKANDSMTQDDKNIAEQTTESGSLGSADQAGGT
jgi:hypothetical protein